LIGSGEGSEDVRVSFPGPIKETGGCLSVAGRRISCHGGGGTSSVTVQEERDVTCDLCWLTFRVGQATPRLGCSASGAGRCQQPHLIRITCLRSKLNEPGLRLLTLSSHLTAHLHGVTICFVDRVRPTETNFQQRTQIFPHDTFHLKISIKQPRPPSPR
jgi:hypothetical protein